MNSAVNIFAPSRSKTASIAGSVMLAVACAALVPVKVHAQEAQNYAGNIIGGVAGALLGSRIGNGNGQIAAAAVGGVLGSIVGGNVEAGMGHHPYQARTYQPRIAQHPGYSDPTNHLVEVPQHSDEIYPNASQYRYERVYPQERLVRYEQPTYVQRIAPIYRQPEAVSERGYAGPIIGGIAGALLASRIGKGNGKTAATALGGVVGAIAGDRIQNTPYTGPPAYAQPYQQSPQQFQTVNRVSYDNDAYTQRRYAMPDRY